MARWTCKMGAPGGRGSTCFRRLEKAVFISAKLPKVNLAANGGDNVEICHRSGERCLPLSTDRAMLARFLLLDRRARSGWGTDDANDPRSRFQTKEIQPCVQLSATPRSSLSSSRLWLRGSLRPAL